MINKKSIWFLTLFSLILVLSVYYVTMPSELLLTNRQYAFSRNYNGTTVVVTVNNDDSDYTMTVRRRKFRNTNHRDSGKQSFSRIACRSRGTNDQRYGGIKKCNKWY